jgi:LPXTG-motif cell wall-anchored protein
MVKQFTTGDDSSFAVESIVPVNDSVAVVQLDNGDIWLTDGTSAGTTELETLAEGAGLRNWGFWNGAEHNTVVSDGNGTLYFWGEGDGSEGSGWNVWSFDGVAFQQITDVDFIDLKTSLYFLDGELYAWAGNRSSDYYASLNHINTSNGVVFEIAGSNNCDDIADSPYNVSLVNSKILFASDLDTCDLMLMSWDPSSPSTPAVDLTVEGAPNYGHSPWDSWIVFEGELYFGGANVGGDRQLWATDGTRAGTRLVKDTNASVAFRPGNDNRMWFTEFLGELYFAAVDPDAEEYMLWKTDGTTAGTVRAIDGLNEPGDCIEYYGLVVGNSMFTDFNCEFYVTDGSSATQLTPESGYGMCWNSCAVPVSFDGNVFFTYHGGEGQSNSVWVTDGTSAGTHAVTDFAVDAIAQGTEFNLVQLGSRLLFGVNDYVDGGGTGEMALYSIAAQNSALAETGANVDWLTLGSLSAIVTGAGFLALGRRKRTA